MSIFASILRMAYKLSGAKKAFALPEDALQKEIEKQNRHRGVFTPTDRKAYYETITVNGFPCLIVRERPKPSERAILYFFGGGMVIGPDKGDLPVMRKLCRETGCDVWFPFYPLCMKHCITETYAMVYECYRKMIEMYGGGNVSTCGFSSGGALALGIAAHNNAQPEPLPRPRHIVAVSPGEVRRKVIYHLYKLPQVTISNEKVLLHDGETFEIDGIKIECFLVPAAPYDAYDESDDTEERSKSGFLKGVGR